jgi:hypothetical protein
MRRLALITLFVFGLAAPAALAAHLTPGDGTVAGAHVNGTVVIYGHGAIWGMVNGAGASIQVTDADPTDGVPKVSGWDTRQFPPQQPYTTVYSTTASDSDGSMRFALVSDGDYRLVLKGSDISFSAVGGGRLRLDGSDTSGPTGRFQLGDDPWQPVPVVSTSYSFPAGP